MTTTTLDDVSTQADPDASGGTTGKILAHEYDGIHEYDNPLPGWWRAIFYGSVVFAIVYFVVFHIGHWADTPDQKYRTEQLAWLADHEEESVAQASSSEEELTAGARDPALVDRGRTIFEGKCATCHTADGHGLIGPNLTDLFQIHGSGRIDLFNTIRDGAPGTAMMAWGTQIPPTDLVAVASFVSSLRGKKLAGKEPQGQPVPALVP